jgi:hypothetical protein
MPISSSTEAGRSALFSSSALRASVLLAAKHAVADELTKKLARHDPPAPDTISKSTALPPALPSDAAWADFPAELQTSAVYRLSNGQWSARPGGRAPTLLAALLRRDFHRLTEDGRIVVRSYIQHQRVVLAVPQLTHLLLARPSADYYQWVGPPPCQIEIAALRLGFKEGPSLQNIELCVKQARAMLDGSHIPASTAAAAAVGGDGQYAAAVHAASLAYTASSIRPDFGSTAPPNTVLPPPSTLMAALHSRQEGAHQVGQGGGGEYEEDTALAIDSIASLLG